MIANGGVQINCARTGVELEALAPAWSALAARAGVPGVFGSPEWLLPWFDHFGDHQAHVFYAWDELGLRAVLPMAQASVDGRRVLIPAGEPFNDEIDVLLRRGVDPSTVREIVSSLLAERAAVDAILIGPTAVGSALHGALVADPAFDLEPLPAPELALPARWEDFRHSARGDARKGWERAFRRMLSEHSVSLRWIADPGEVRETMQATQSARLGAWEARGRLDEIPPVQTTEAFAAFLGQAFGNLAAVKSAAVAQLSAEGIPVATDAYLLRAPEALLYQGWFDVAFQRFSPGNLLTFAVVRILIDQGVTLLHLGRGDEKYKFRLGAEPRTLMVGLWKWFV